MIIIARGRILFCVAIINILFIDCIKANINWNGNNWAMSCDFRGNDLSNIQSSGEDCSGKCAATARCTHFTWTRWNGGTCWMKSGSVSKANAFSTNDPAMVCGIVHESQSSK